MIMWHPQLEWKALYRTHFQPGCIFCLSNVDKGTVPKSLCRVIRKPASHKYCQGECLWHIWKHCDGVRSIYKPMTGWSVKIRPATAPPLSLSLSFDSLVLLSLLIFLPAVTKVGQKPCLSVQICLCMCVFFNCHFWSVTGQNGLLEDHHCHCSCGCNYRVLL